MKTLLGHTGGISSVSFSPDGFYFVSGSKDHTCRIWLVENDFELYRVINNTGDTFPISSVTFSAFGRYFAAGSYDNCCSIWDVEKDFSF